MDLTPPDLATRYLELTVSTMQTHPSAIVQVGVLRSLRGFGSKLCETNPAVITPALPHIFEGVCAFAHGASPVSCGNVCHCHLTMPLS